MLKMAGVMTTRDIIPGTILVRHAGRDNSAFERSVLVVAKAGEEKDGARRIVRGFDLTKPLYRWDEDCLDDAFPVNPLRDVSAHNQIILRGGGSGHNETSPLYLLADARALPQGQAIGGTGFSLCPVFYDAMNGQIYPPTLQTRRPEKGFLLRGWVKVAEKKLQHDLAEGYWDISTASLDELHDAWAGERWQKARHARLTV